LLFLRCNPDKAFAEIFATVEAGYGAGDLLDTFKNVFAVPNHALPYPLGKLLQGFGKTVGVIKNDKTLHACSFLFMPSVPEL
jgi:hypothetical protein